MQYDSLYIKLETSKNESILARNASIGGKSMMKGRNWLPQKSQRQLILGLESREGI